MRFLPVVALFVTSTSLFSLPASAQDPAAVLRVGQARLFSSSADQITITSALLHRVSADVAIGLEGGYTSLPHASNADLRIWQLTGLTRFQGDTGPVRPYILVGAGLYHVHDSISDLRYAVPLGGFVPSVTSSHRDQWHTGANLGLGTSLPVGEAGFHVGLESRFHTVSRGNNSKLEWWTVAGGIGYR